MKEKITATVHPHHGEPFDAIVLSERKRPHEYEVRYLGVNERWETTWLPAAQIELHAASTTPRSK